MVIAPDGRVHAQAQLRQEMLLVTDIDISLATQAMFRFDPKDCAKVLFSDTVRSDEFASILPDDA